MKNDLDMLTESIAAAPKHMIWLVTVYGTARSHKAFSSWFAQAAATSGLEDGKSAHGLRKARAKSLLRQEPRRTRLPPGQVTKRCPKCSDMPKPQTAGGCCRDQMKNKNWKPFWKQDGKPQ